MSSGSESEMPDLPTPSLKQINDLIESIGLPIPLTIEPFTKSTGTYHSIYALAFTKTCPMLSEVQISGNGTKDLILRVSVPDFPVTKNRNEVAIMKWVRQSTTIPIPRVIASSSATNNPLGHEFTLLERCPGVLLSEIAEELSENDEKQLLSQLAHYQMQLFRHSWAHIGGLRQQDGDFVPNPMVGEQFWHGWDSNFENPLELNPEGPYEDLDAFFIDQIRKHQMAIRLHPKLTSMRDLPIIELLSAIQEPSFKARLNSPVRRTIAHRDLHFRNILCDAETRVITAIIDWELAAVVPYPLWNPGNFLWNGSEDDVVARRETARLMKAYEQVVWEQDLGQMITDEDWMNEEQRVVQQATLSLKHLVNACVRGWSKGKVPEYRAEFQRAAKQATDLARTMAEAISPLTGRGEAL